MVRLICPVCKKHREEENTPWDKEYEKDGEQITVICLECRTK